MRRQDNRRGGLTRAARLTPERRQEIAAAGSESRQIRRVWGVPKREIIRRITDRIALANPDLARLMAFALGESGHLAVWLVNQLNENAFAQCEDAVLNTFTELGRERIER